MASRSDTWWSWVLSRFRYLTEVKSSRVHGETSAEDILATCTDAKLFAELQRRGLYTDAKLLQEVKARSLVKDTLWSVSDVDAQRAVGTYYLPLFLAGFPAWYVDHPLFVLRMHMEYEGAGVRQAATRILQQEEGIFGFFAGSTSYGLKKALTQRRLPNGNEIRERVCFSAAGLRLPIAFAGTSLSLDYCTRDKQDLRLTGACSFIFGFVGALCSVPAETLMRNSTFSHADFVKGREQHSHFLEQHFLKRVLWKAMALDPVRPKTYSDPATFAGATDLRSLCRGWPLHCTGFGCFFAAFCCTYEYRTGHKPGSSWINGNWQDVLHNGSLAIVLGSCAMLPCEIGKALVHRVQSGRLNNDRLSLAKSAAILLGQRIGSHYVQFGVFASLVYVSKMFVSYDKTPTLWLCRGTGADAWDKPALCSASRPAEVAGIGS